MKWSLGYESWDKLDSWCLSYSCLKENKLSCEVIHQINVVPRSFSDTQYSPCWCLGLFIKMWSTALFLKVAQLDEWKKECKFTSTLQRKTQ